jgi:hypothetical protein
MRTSIRLSSLLRVVVPCAVLLCAVPASAAPSVNVYRGVEAHWTVQAKWSVRYDIQVFAARHQDGTAHAWLYADRCAPVCRDYVALRRSLPASALTIDGRTGAARLRTSVFGPALRIDVSEASPAAAPVPGYVNVRYDGSVATGAFLLGQTARVQLGRLACKAKGATTYTDVIVTANDAPTSNVAPAGPAAIARAATGC